MYPTGYTAVLLNSEVKVNSSPRFTRIWHLKRDQILITDCMELVVITVTS